MGHWCSIFLAFFCLKSIQAYLDQSTKNLILSMHNNLREQVSRGELSGQPRSMPLAPLFWDTELEHKAELHAQRCVLRHDYPTSTTYTDLGQNLAGADDVASGIQLWINEKDDYRYHDKYCRKVCLHYTQMVSNRSKAIGCAIKDCTDRWSYKINIVCNYGPMGNIVGKKPYELYRSAARNGDVKPVRTTPSRRHRRDPITHRPVNLARPTQKPVIRATNKKQQTNSFQTNATTTARRNGCVRITSSSLLTTAALALFLLCLWILLSPHRRQIYSINKIHGPQRV